jgi:hypothetical protein
MGERRIGVLQIIKFLSGLPVPETSEASNTASLYGKTFIWDEGAYYSNIPYKTPHQCSE